MLLPDTWLVNSGLLEEDRERRIIRRHKETLGEELAALVAEQAQD